MIPYTLLSWMRALLALALLMAGAGLFPGTMRDAHAAGERCFGAVGQACGGWTNNSAMPSVAFCIHTNGIGINQGVCLVNGGSMAHDPCCYSHRNGKMCGGSPENSWCRVEWERAVSRTFWGYNWKRVLDVNRENNTGVVERSLYCARPGKGVHRNDVGFCCSSRARPARFWENVGRPNLKICE